MSKTIVHLLRHGEVHNPTGILYGRIPGFRLSATGERQALTVAEYLREHDITHVVASPLERAQQTATPIAASHRLELATDDRLIESENVFQGQRVSVGDGALRSPKNWPHLRNPLRPSWGEPYLQIAHRMLAAVYRARDAADGHEAVCVSHQLPVWTLRRYLEGKRLWHNPAKRECSLASLTSLVFDDEQLIDIRYAEPVGGSDPKATGA
ncbi:Broad specificity phosphatase PhoE [Actinokineospora alba]|uniref:Broad specificity phosphatase PhoE n=1 Tax=Actinokineospora alba TaxID=504798 RepID=A0A1H0WPV3_9PSEU|nr:histidine phosphatase family protein [Actinokineospora alba]TDP65672.1 broad specificity phosphatase PhoE [Actinokineospora alba]SDJ54999.1 Broad specificity phosphatase PhoE [Actinokineospora alba]SDP92485.1 Broad specificity phosphatase PhoE [Actinokineospora alba]